MPDIYGRIPQQFGGAFSADSALIQFSGAGGLPGGGGGVGLLCQALGWQYAQPINRIYEIGTRLVYYVAGRPRGDGSIQSIVGPKQIQQAFYSTYGSVCNGLTNNVYINASVGCNGETTPGNYNMQLTGVVLTNIGGQARAEDMVIGEALQYMYVALINTAIPA
jgi:hypothetical protein